MRGIECKRHEGIREDDKNALYLDCDGYMCIHSAKTLNGTLKMSASHYR